MGDRGIERSLSPKNEGDSCLEVLKLGDEGSVKPLSPIIHVGVYSKWAEDAV